MRRVTRTIKRIITGRRTQCRLCCEFIEIGGSVELLIEGNGRRVYHPGYCLDWVLADENTDRECEREGASGDYDLRICSLRKLFEERDPRTLERHPGAKMV